ncbi:MAG: hypothetical protein A2622_11730 [Bdellovibrionales bacterium RIFCSPHIGHO2_01_FULL_40_29]|nr:MAG: hypothetical protein A2622_11730 [Bdellovibrionales bacterium RIFCSPHIGHO2_01_FULL_40_29]OFZ35277.1 MAG: hypothetical protein A3D17_08725 [Bdellovibrionales bacterium RIFCSPHIGHO2_02_FULL_40_15]
MIITSVQSKAIIFFLIVSTFLVGCSSSSEDTPGIISSISDSIKDIVSPDSSVSTAEKQVVDIQKKMNQDSNYALTSEDVQFLQDQGIAADDSELKAWVK